MVTNFSQPDEQDELQPGSQFEGFLVERQLGKGGFGVTYLLAKKDENLQLVMKVMKADRLHSKEDIEAFYAELSNTLQIPAHPNIARVLNAWVDPRTYTPYLSTEYFPHGDLWTYAKKNGRFSNFECWWVLLNVVEGMRFLFEQAKILHRDLKPQNLLLDENGIIKIIDFGLAKAFAVDPARQNQLSTSDRDAAVGTPHFKSPEQIQGERDIDARSDIWSIGVTLYWLATGKLPFQGSKFEQDIVTLEPPPPSQINPSLDQSLEALILRCMRKDRAARFQSFRELELAAMDGARQIPDFLEKVATGTRFVTIEAIQGYLTPYLDQSAQQPASAEYAPDGSDWLSYVQRIYQIITINNLPLAQEMVDRALAQDPTQPIIRCYQAMLYVRLGQFELAHSAFEQLFALKDPKGRVVPAMAYAEAIQFYFLIREYDLAHAVERRALDRLASETDPQYRQHFEETIQDAVAELNGELDKSVAQEFGLDIDLSLPAKDNAALDQLQASRASLQAIEFARRGLYEPALQLFRTAVSKSPQDGYIWADLGTCLMENQQYAEAYEALQQAQAFIPDDFITWLHLGLVSEQLAKPEEALAYYERAIQIDGHNPQAWFQKGLLLSNKLRKYREAITCFEQAQRLGHTEAASEIADCRELLR